MITSKSAVPGDGDRFSASTANSIVRKTPRQKKLRFIAQIQEASSNDVDPKPFAERLGRTARFRRRRTTRICCRQSRDTAIARLARCVWWLKQHTGGGLIGGDGRTVICRWKEIIVAVLNTNFGIEIERNHPVHFVENL